MVRFRLLYCILLASVFFMGCGDGDITPPGETAHKTYLQVRILRACMESRTVGSPTTPGTKEENAIADAVLYMTDGNSIAKVVDISLSNTSDNSYISALIPIERDMLGKEYRLFLVANPGKAGLPLRFTQNFKDVYSSGITGTSGLVTPGQIVMSNQVEQSPGPAVVITKENTETDPARAEILLDRIAVKIVPQVSVGFGADFTDRDNEAAFFEDYTFTVDGAGLLNAATEFGLEQKWGVNIAGKPVQLLSPTWYYKPEKQYFEKYYNTINDYTGAGSPPFTGFGESPVDGYRLITSPFYCLENNPPLYDYTGSVLTPENQVETKYKGLTTGVIFKVRAVKDNVPADIYRYEGVYYPGTESGRQALAVAADLLPDDFNDVSVLRGKGIKVFEDGDIYYTYWIRDRNYDLSYAVVRNSCYLLKVNGLTRIGDDIPGGGYEPGEPIDKIERIEVVAICKDWTFVDVTHEFN